VVAKEEMKSFREGVAGAACNWKHQPTCNNNLKGLYSFFNHERIAKYHWLPTLAKDNSPAFFQSTLDNNQIRKISDRAQYVGMLPITFATPFQRFQAQRLCFVWSTLVAKPNWKMID
jgi:hypothetical protein